MREPHNLANYSTELQLLMNEKINLYLPDIGIMVKMFTNGQVDLDSIPGRVISKTQKNGTWCLLA